MRSPFGMTARARIVPLDRLSGVVNEIQSALAAVRRIIARCDLDFVGERPALPLRAP